MFYIEQVTRSMARRLEWVLKDYHPWTLPANTEAEDRQIDDAPHRVADRLTRRSEFGLTRAGSFFPGPGCGALVMGAVIADIIGDARTQG